MTEHDTPTTAIATLMGEANLRPEQLARLVNTYAERAGEPSRVDPKTPYKWRTGKTPHQPWPQLVAAVLSDVLRRTITPATLGWPDTVPAYPASSGLILPWTRDGALSAAHAVTEESPSMLRRMFLTVTGTALTAPALEWLVARPVGDSSARAGRRLPAHVVDHLNGITGNLRQMDDDLGSGTTLGLAREHLKVVVGLLRDCSYDAATGRALHSCVGEALRLTGWLAFDAGHYSSAQRLWYAALYQAHCADDKALGANIVAFLSLQAKDLGEVRHAVTLAEAARASHPSATPQVASILALRAAEAHAHARDHLATSRAVEDALCGLDRLPPEHGNPDWSYWMTPAQAHAQAGYSYMILGDWTNARTHLNNAQRLQSSEHTREGALRNTLLALTYAQQNRPDLDRALAHANRAVATLTGQVTSSRVVKHVAELHRVLAPYRRTPAVAEFVDASRPLLAV